MPSVLTVALGAWVFGVITLAPVSTPAPAPPAVAVISPSGGEHWPELEPALVEALDAQGRSVTRLRLGAREGSSCAGSMVDPSCIDGIRRQWTDQRPSILVLGSITVEAESRRVEVLVLHRDESEPIARLDARFVAEDRVLPIVFPMAVARAVERHGKPPARPTEHERAVLSQLDEPPAAAIAPVADLVTVSSSEPGREVPSSSPRIEPVAQVLDDRGVDEALDLRRDFDEICRQGARRRRASRDEPRDLRPRCRLGPVFGYVRPRTWVTATLAVASGIASGIAFRARGSGSYSERTQRKTEAWGTAAAATSAVLGVGVVTLTIGDRWQARRYLQDERWLAAH